MPLIPATRATTERRAPTQRPRKTAAPPWRSKKSSACSTFGSSRSRTQRQRQTSGRPNRHPRKKLVESPATAPKAPAAMARPRDPWPRTAAPAMMRATSPGMANPTKAAVSAKARAATRRYRPGTPIEATAWRTASVKPGSPRWRAVRRAPHGRAGEAQLGGREGPLAPDPPDPGGHGHHPEHRHPQPVGKGGDGEAGSVGDEHHSGPAAEPPRGQAQAGPAGPRARRLV